MCSFFSGGLLWYISRQNSLKKKKKQQNNCRLETVCKGLLRNCEMFASVSTHLANARDHSQNGLFPVFFSISIEWNWKKLIWNQISFFFCHAKMVGVMQGPALRKDNASTKKSKVVSPGQHLALIWCSLRECVTYGANYQWVWLLKLYLKKFCTLSFLILCFIVNWLSSLLVIRSNFAGSSHLYILAGTMGLKPVSQKASSV